jgi:hypothetical protein
MDKMLVIIIIFLAVTFVFAGILIMGAVPELFKQGEQLDQALIQQHEDEARANQTLHEDQARDKQATQIVKETNKSINVLEHRLTKFINESVNRSITGQIERQAIIDNVLNISKQHEIVAKDHNILQVKVQNITEQIYNLLKEADERNFQATMANKALLNNLTEELKEIKTLHKEIKQEIESINSNPIS